MKLFFLFFSLSICSALEHLGLPNQGTRRQLFNVAAGLAIPTVAYDSSASAEELGVVEAPPAPIVEAPPATAAEAPPIPIVATTAKKPAEAIEVYRVIPDSSASLNPLLESLDVPSFLKDISHTKGGAVWLGEHHNSPQDQKIQTDLLGQLCQERRSKDSKIAVGLEQVQVQFQPVLDDFVAGKLSLTDLRKGVEWDQRWSSPFELYEPLFSTAQKLSIPLVALAVDLEDLMIVAKNGLSGLPKDRLSFYIPDTPGFAAFARRREFTTYVDYVIRPRYDMDENRGLIKATTMPFRNFFSGRILWDESMATRAYQWTQSNPGGLLLGLVGADHVKFQNGTPARYARMAAGKGTACVSVLLNPTLTDTRPLDMDGGDSSRSDSITLQIRYLKDNVDVNSPDRMLPSATGGVLPLADYLILG